MEALRAREDAINALQSALRRLQGFEPLESAVADVESALEALKRGGAE